MTVVPIFIHVREKSDKELREEMAREARWNEIMRREEELKRERIAAEKRKKEEARARAEEEERKLYFQHTYDDEWDTQILPEGWSIFGQTFFGVLRERNKYDFEPEAE